MHGMPHARLLLWHPLLWGHYATYGCHWGSSHMGLTWPGYETLVTGQLGLHLFLLAGKKKKKKNTPSHQGNDIFPSQCRNKQVEKWVLMSSCTDFTLLSSS